MPKEEAAGGTTENGDDKKEDASAGAGPPPFATLALALIVPDWTDLGNDESTAAVPETKSTNDLDTLVDRATALLLVRCVALVAPLGHFPDISTSNICRSVLMNKRRKWPSKLTDQVQGQLREFCKRMLAGYKDVPYHNREHAWHVLHSTCRLVDCFLCTDSDGTTVKPKRRPPSYGLRHDPLALLALAFAALIHDVEHQGIPNRQLALEDDRLAILYNDQSIAENWSIYVAFSELLQDDFKELRDALFPTKDVYHRFRKIVINLVLCTDIASPERTQISKSKWKEAFGDPFETVERKMVAQARRMSLTGQVVRAPSSSSANRMGRRGTGDVSEMSFDDGLGLINDDSDGSISVTPDNSETQEESVDNNIAATPGSHLLSASAMGTTSSPTPNSPRQLSSTHKVPAPEPGVVSRRYSYAAAGTTPDAMGVAARRYSRRRSSTATSATTAKYRQRLGIMRTVDLSGETLVNFNPGTSSRKDSMATILTTDQPFSVHLDEDEPNELKATVVMETIIACADVAHNLQGWPQMAKFSSRLYLELRKAFVANQGGDPEPRWFENQIGFLESYLLPLAHRLEDTGVFPEKIGECFALIVERNRDKWLTHGFTVSQDIIKQGAKEYPLPE